MSDEKKPPYREIVINAADAPDPRSHIRQLVFPPGDPSTNTSGLRLTGDSLIVVGSGTPLQFRTGANDGDAPAPTERERELQAIRALLVGKTITAVDVTAWFDGSAAEVVLRCSDGSAVKLAAAGDHGYEADITFSPL